jgi:hypothetical protein
MRTNSILACTFLVACAPNEHSIDRDLPSDRPSGGKADDLTSRPVEICPGVTADAGGVMPASAALQACLDATPTGGELALSPGVYRISSLVRVGRGITLHTAGVPGNAPACLIEGAPACATLRADADLSVARGFVQLEDHDVTVEHIVIDGNRQARLHSEAAQHCAAGTNGPGFNAIAAGCTRCSFVMSATINALCGTGFEWNGRDAFIGGNLVRDNGDHTTHNMWADGITVTFTENAEVVANYFADNSDVDLILGSNRGGLVHQNQIHHDRQDAFAGLMLDNFNDHAPGDFREARVLENTIACNGRCDYGIQLGPHPWYPSSNIRGGMVAANTVDGARMGIDVDGAGTPDAPITVTGNQVGAAPATAMFMCGQRPSSRFNVSPDAVVDLAEGPLPDTAMLVHDCP